MSWKQPKTTNGEEQGEHNEHKLIQGERLGYASIVRRFSVGGLARIVRAKPDTGTLMGVVPAPTDQKVKLGVSMSRKTSLREAHITRVCCCCTR